MDTDATLKKGQVYSLCRMENVRKDSMKVSQTEKERKKERMIERKKENRTKERV